jgi:hypothetical protein
MIYGYRLADIISIVINRYSPLLLRFFCIGKSKREKAKGWGRRRIYGK